MTGAVRTYCSPASYVQGPGVLGRVGEYVARSGSRVLVVVDALVREDLGSVVEESCRAAALSVEVLPVQGQVTRRHVTDLVALVADGPRCDVVVGVGGGKALDLAKGVASELGARMVSVPTIASNDGPTARVFALYDESDVLVELGSLPASPDCVVVDTDVIAKAPADFLRSGIGDALAKRFEAQGCAAGTGVTTQGTRPLLIGAVVASAAYDVLLEHAPAAVRAVEEDRVTDAVEAAVEAAVLLSGIGYENGGLSIAHCMTRGLMAGRGTSRRLHGYHVAYGLLVQLELERWPAAQLAEVRGVLADVGLPSTLAELGMPDPTPDELEALATACAAAPHVANSTAEVTVESLVAAIQRVESAGAKATTSRP